jgi:hypothetical protein
MRTRDSRGFITLDTVRQAQGAAIVESKNRTASLSFPVFGLWIGPFKIGLGVRVHQLSSYVENGAEQRLRHHAWKSQRSVQRDQHQFHSANAPSVARGSVSMLL